MAKFKVDMHEMRGEMLEKNNQTVQGFLGTAHMLLKGNGWEFDGQKLQSALYHRTYTKGDQVLNISGWHGTGRPGTNRFYGASKSFLYLYHTTKAHKTVAKIEAEVFDCDTFEEVIANQNKAMISAVQYISTVACVGRK